MSRKCRSCFGLLALLWLLGGGQAIQAQSINVFVDGQALTTSAPPREVNWRIMVGMRDIFERLGAKVKWDAAEQRITATRGARTVVLWIARPLALVDGATLPLDVPPMLIGNYTYVPVRFPSEALGADVGWVSATQSVMISTQGMPPIEEPKPPPPPPPPPKQAKGVLLQMASGAATIVLIKDYDTGAADTYIVAPTAVFQRGEADAAVLKLVRANEVRPGDDVTLSLNDERRAERVQARYRTAQAKFQAVAVNSLLAQNGQVYQLGSDVQVGRRGGGSAALADLRPGDDITLRLNPVSGQVWEITAPPAPPKPPPPPPPAGPQIITIGAEGYTRPIPRGALLVVAMQGTPGGQATFDIGAARKGIAMSEKRPGVYVGEYRLEAGDFGSGVKARLVGHLSVKGVAAPQAMSAETVTLDTASPTIPTVFPDGGARVATTRPIIQCVFDDGIRGVGVDATSVRLQVRGQDVTRQATITGDGLTYRSAGLALGEVPVRVQIADRAGNTAAKSWTFALVAAPDQETSIVSVTHTPTGRVLGSGAVLTVTMQAQPRGRSASFDIPGVRDKIAMVRQDGPDSDLWVGTYEVQPGDNAQKVRVLGRFVDRQGLTSALADPQPLDINGAAPTKLSVTEPANGVKVATTFRLAGTAPPGLRVSYHVTFSGRSELLNIALTGIVADGEALVDNKGAWEVAIDGSDVSGNPFIRQVDRLRIRCVLLGTNQPTPEKIDLTVTPTGW